MNNKNIDPKHSYSLLGRIEGAEKLLLSGRRNREQDLESAVTIFLELLRGFESFALDQKCITVFGRLDSKMVIPIINWRLNWEGSWQTLAMPL